MEHKASSNENNHDLGLTNGDGFANGDDEMLLNEDLKEFGGLCSRLYSLYPLVNIRATLRRSRKTRYACQSLIS